MNQMHRFNKTTQLVLILVEVAIVFSAAFASAVEMPRQGEEFLRSSYHRNQAKLEKNSFGFPLFLESFEQDDRVHVDVYGIFEFPFSNVVDMLKVAANWCDIVSLHPNVKACTYRELSDAWQLTFYLGRKVYQRPEETRQVTYLYRSVAQRPGYLDLVLSADEGPFGSKDHKLRFEALPLDGGRAFVHVSYSYSDSMALRLAGKVYFSTLGYGKVGFTVIGTDNNGQPVYIGGPRGAIERNAVRYYLAIQSFMNTSHYSEESRFSMRISEWYDLTSRYPKQLVELDKESYLTLKATEHNNQMILQRGIGTGLP